VSPSTRPGLDVAREAGVLRLTLDRAEQRNALDDATTEALIAELEAANQDDTVRAIVLRGRGDDFCAGFDLVGRNAPGPARPRAGSIQRRLPAQAHRLVALVASVQIPIVSAVRGWAVGIGLHLAVAADFCVAAHDARFWEPFMTRGFTPDSGGTWLLPRLVGFARAKELLLLGR
jgi:2-(1,2-epoxy-1,2-dihydrophenyl)acetyl-CoA isomerase